MTPKKASIASCAVYLCLGPLLAGCGLFEQREPETAAAATAKSGRVKSPARSAKAGVATPLRQVGELFVYRFSGSFAPVPLTLTEEVVAKEASAWVVDFALAEAAQVERLRVRFDIATGEPLSVARLEGKRETPAKLGDYEALMARTICAADVNDGLVAAENATCLVGTDELDCETKTYKVWVGEAEAKLSVAHAARFPDRDVSGEMTSHDGKLIYRAELVEATRATPASGVALR